MQCGSLLLMSRATSIAVISVTMIAVATTLRARTLGRDYGN
jgi:hypothetical protein